MWATCEQGQGNPLLPLCEHVNRAINKMHGYMSTMNLWEFNAGFGARWWQTIMQLRWQLWCRMNCTRASYHVCLRSFHGKFIEYSKKPTVSGRSMLKYMNKNVFTHRIWPHFYTNVIFQTKEHSSPPKTLHVTVSRSLDPIWRVYFGNNVCGYVGPFNPWEFHARVFSLADGFKKICTGAGGFGLQ